MLYIWYGINNENVFIFGWSILLRSQAFNWLTTILSRDIKRQQKEKTLQNVLSSEYPALEWLLIEKYYGAVTVSTSRGMIMHPIQIKFQCVSYSDTF